MGAEIGKSDGLGAYVTNESSVTSRAAQAPPPETDVEEASTSGQAPAATKKSPAKKASTKEPPIPASQPPKRPKVALPPGLYEEMHRVKNRWLAADEERMDVYNKPLGVENTFMVTLLAFATATLKAEVEKDGGASTTFPDYIPQKPGSN